jgi:hypothetical protein
MPRNVNVTHSNARFSMRILIYQENILVARAKNMQKFLFFFSLFFFLFFFFFFSFLRS